MIPEDKLRAIARRLIERSKEGDVAWIPSDPDGFYVDVGSSRIGVGFVSPPTEPDWYYLRVGPAAPRGKIANFVGSLIGITGEHSDDDTSLLAELHQEAERVVTGWDKIVDEIERKLSEGGRIGASMTSDLGQDSNAGDPF